MGKKEVDEGIILKCNIVRILSARKSRPAAITEMENRNFMWIMESICLKHENIIP
jgi:hypothetical protein